MTQGGIVALLALLFAQIGQVISSWVQTNQMKVQIAELTRGIAKENANRRMQLEDKVDEVYRYIDGVRHYLHKLVNEGVIDVHRIDMAVFVPPPRPKYNGDPKPR